MDEMSTAIVRQKPYDRNAERSVIGAMILSNEAVIVASGILSPTDFYLKENQLLFEAIIELTEENREIDPVVLADRAKEKGLSGDIANLNYLGDLSLSVPSSANVKEYADIVREKSVLRNLIDVTENITSACYKAQEPLEDIMEQTEKNIFAVLQNSGSSKEQSIAQIAMNAFRNIQAASKQTGSVTGIPSGFYELDYKTAGFQKSNLILIAARPAMGKTAFVLNIAEYVAIKKQIPIALFSLEMSSEELVKRMMAMNSKVDSQKLRNGSDLSSEDWRSLMDSTIAISKTKLFLDDRGGLTITELRSKCRKLKVEHDIQMVIIDYLQLMSGGSRSESRQQEISEISRSLKTLAKELEIPIIALSQLSRAVESRPDKRPMLSDLRESGAIEQDADMVMFLYRDDYYNKDSKEPGVAEVIIGKQRSGPTGTVKLSWLGQYTKFANLETEYK